MREWQFAPSITLLDGQMCNRILFSDSHLMTSADSAAAIPCCISANPSTSAASLTRSAPLNSPTCAFNFIPG